MMSQLLVRGSYQITRAPPPPPARRPLSPLSTPPYPTPPLTPHFCGALLPVGSALQASQTELRKELDSNRALLAVQRHVS